MPDAPRPARGVLDTSVVIDLDELAASQLPIEVAVSAITMAELAAGPHATTDADVRGRRQDRLYTRNGDDFTGLDGLIDIHVV